MTATVPGPLFIAAQIVLGISLGSRFDRNLIRRLPRVAAAALLVSGFLILASVIGAAGLSAATGLSFATSFLAIAPAGVTEMVLTARVMHLDTAAVTAFHVMRIAFIQLTVLMTYKLYERLSLRLEKRKT
jgi:membrane AbrB-like protein